MQSAIKIQFVAFMLITVCSVLEILAYFFHDSISPSKAAKYEDFRKAFKPDYDICGTVDPALQCQNIDHSGEHRFLFWKAICDERLIDTINEYIVEFLVYYQGPVPFGYNRTETLNLAKTWRCHLENGVYYRETTVDLVTNIGNKHSPFILACHIPKRMKCPTKAWITFGNITLTNKMDVEKQLSPKSSSKKPTSDDVTVTLCASPIMSKEGTMYDSPIRIGEWLAYNKFIGVDRIVIPLPDMDNPDMHIYVNPKILKLINSYKKSGLVNTFQFPLHLQGLYMVPKNNPVYETINMLKGLLYTYCYLRHALVSSHFLVHDMDEIISFPVKKYQNIQNLISTIISSQPHEDFSSFIYRDVVFPDIKKCHSFDQLFEKDVEKVFANNSVLRAKMLKEGALTKLSKYISKPFHMGKSIIHSKDCICIWFHFCWWRVSDQLLHRAHKETAVKIQMNQGTLAQWSYGSRKGHNYTSVYEISDLYKINNIHFRKLDETKVECTQLRMPKKMVNENTGLQLREQIFEQLANVKRQFLI